MLDPVERVDSQTVESCTEEACTPDDPSISEEAADDSHVHHHSVPPSDIDGTGEDTDDQHYDQDSQSEGNKLRNSRNQFGYSCNVCGNSYSRRGYLNRHMKKHQAFEFACTICERGFYRKDQLKLHMQVHSKHRPFGCLHCSKCFKRRSALTRHMRTIHEMASSAPSSLSCSTVPSTGGLNATAPAVEKQTIVSEPNPLTLNMAPYSTSPHVSPSNNLLLTPGPMVPGFMMPSRDQPNPFVGAEPPMYSYALPWQSPYVWTVVSPVIPQPLSQPTKLPLPVMSPLNQGMFWPQILPQAPTANSISWFAQTIPSTTS